MTLSREEIQPYIDEYAEQFGLTPKLRDCLVYMCLGHHVDEIAKIHKTSLNTVRTQCAHLTKLCRVRTKYQLIADFLGFYIERKKQNSGL